MDIRQLRYLIALVQEAHFSRAAARCNVSQPALSAQIKRLEEDLGVPLIKRGNSYGGLTPEGERVITWARRIVGDADGLMDAAALLRGELAGTLNIGVVPSALAVVPLLTQPLLARYPELRFRIVSASSKGIQRGLDDLSFDAGITYLDNEPLKAVDALGLYHEEFSLLIPEEKSDQYDHTIAWSALGGLPLCLLSPEMQNRRIIDRVFAEVGIAPEPLIESNSVATLYGHVRTAKLSTIIARNHFTSFGVAPGVALKRLDPPHVRQQIGLVRHETQVHAPRVAALWEIAQQRDVAALVTESAQ